MKKYISALLVLSLLVSFVPTPASAQRPEPSLISHLGQNLTGFFTNPWTIGIGAAILTTIVILKSQAHHEANTFVQNFQNPFHVALAKIVDAENAAYTARQLPLADANKAWDETHLLWAEFLRQGDVFGAGGSDEAKVWGQAKNQLGPLMIQIFADMEIKIRALGGTVTPWQAPPLTAPSPTPSPSGGLLGGNQNTALRIGDRIEVLLADSYYESLGVFPIAKADLDTVLGWQPRGAKGKIVSGPSNGYWYIDYDTGADGWSAAATSGNVPALILAPSFSPGVKVQVLVNSVNVRSNPNYANSSNIIGTQSRGAQGTIITGPFLADGVSFWHINWDTGADGWSGERYQGSNYLGRVDSSTPAPTPTPTPNPTTPVSTKFQIGDAVKVTTDDINVRATPSITGTILSTQDGNALGTVIGGPIAQGGYIWWNIDYASGADGWTAEQFLEENIISPVSPPTPTPTPVTPPTPTPTPPTSTTFAISDRIQVVSTSLNVRSAPGGTIIDTQALGTQGTVVGGPVEQGGHTWWNIDYVYGADGWSAEQYIAKIPGSATPPPVIPPTIPTPTPTPTTPTPTPTPNPTTPVYGTPAFYAGSTKVASITCGETATFKVDGYSGSLIWLVQEKRTSIMNAPVKTFDGTYGVPSTYTYRCNADEGIYTATAYTVVNGQRGSLLGNASVTVYGAGVTPPPVTPPTPTPTPSPTPTTTGNPQCGAANGMTYNSWLTFQPVNKCAAGNTGGIIDNTTRWDWTCFETGKPTVQCSANNVPPTQGPVATVSLVATPNSTTASSLNNVNLTVTRAFVDNYSRSYYFLCDKSKTGVELVSNYLYSGSSLSTNSIGKTCSYSAPGTYVATVYSFAHMPNGGGDIVRAADAVITVGPPPPVSLMSGTLTASPMSCTIPFGGSSCKSYLTWNVVSPESALTSIVEYGTQTTITTGHSGSNFEVTISPRYQFWSFVIKNNGKYFSQKLLTASCAAGVWDGMACSCPFGQEENPATHQCVSSCAADEWANPATLQCEPLAIGSNTVNNTQMANTLSSLRTLLESMGGLLK